MRASWLMLVLAACGCFPTGRALCWQSSICSDLRSKERLLDCLSMCTSRGPAILPTDSSLGPENGLLVDLLLSSLGGPQDPLPSGPGPRGRGEDRRSYAMEHFRWGKPAGRKRRPVKVHAVSGEEGGDVLVEAGYGPKGRRPPPGGREDGGDGEGEEVVVLDVRDLQEQPVQGVTLGPQTGSRSSQETKDPATYRMSHFRWGSPSKRRNGYLAPWEETHKKPLSRFFGSSFKLVH